MVSQRAHLGALAVIADTDDGDAAALDQGDQLLENHQVVR